MTYPAFPGGAEAGYLRAQLTRITVGTAIAPAGYYKVEEEEEAAEEVAFHFNARICDELRLRTDSVYRWKTLPIKTPCLDWRRPRKARCDMRCVFVQLGVRHHAMGTD
eukprot:SAG31_NODE_3983_length_3688_cov_5.820006_2_plen_108_part_00